MTIDRKTIRRIINAALDEDIGKGDITSETVIPVDAGFAGAITARQDLVVAGIGFSLEAFHMTADRMAKEITVDILINDGDRVTAGTELARIEGNAWALLAAERTALNLLQHLSGIATLTRTYADAIEGTGAVLLDTRKTIPGLRDMAKYAARMGGAENHRLRLDSGILIKDNHIAAAGGIAIAVARAKNIGIVDIEVECDTLNQVEEAITAGADAVLLDNMDMETLRRAATLTKGRCRTEASGGITLENIRAVAETGVNYISVGRITHSAPAVDIGLDRR
ncbi:MAG: nicotinate-nucleotide diphosphorylase (carboxylating) [Rhodospirillales bacterium RIFCSPLOWO2_12_FULL_58_28]|nr:MAG: nicotinate-nucleotide diphosphorylase (carboxylating) [Rhodospirillales bacterium RIFCSPLOWO2_02_FULL_58_16]OHC79355.1 MAG: nicotinate-nucleotide diphosphorylase (carboxylating) [Rhodospirillales bacterium RIFCSPLOWO2_12_FULL_58_28]